jgi:hypothetical protein
MHNMEHYTFIGRDDTIPRNPEPLYVDPYGYTDYTPPNETNDYYEPFPVHLRNPSELGIATETDCYQSDWSVRNQSGNQSSPTPGLAD